MLVAGKDTPQHSIEQREAQLFKRTNILLIFISVLTQVIIENPAWLLARKLRHKSRYLPTGEYNDEGLEARWRLPL